MDFQVNNQTYFVNLAEDSRHWEVLVSTPTGALSIPVYEDAPDSAPLLVIQEQKQSRPN